MSSSALALALAAAFLHAGWNVLLARANDVQAATAVVLGVSTIALAPIAAFTWDVDRGVVPWAVGSAAFELAYEFGGWGASQRRDGSCCNVVENRAVLRHDRIE
mgnify:CR=1 FL=1